MSLKENQKEGSYFTDAINILNAISPFGASRPEKNALSASLY
jgi:hypothetical protein